MPIYLPDRLTSHEPGRLSDALTPRQIVAELDKYVVGQHKAKRAVAIALRNRMRRRKLPKEMAEEVAPKNILMIGPTGVGKTEIARRLARLAQSPFLKVEASKFTEVGYVGRDVESMVRDLVELAIDMVREERVVEVRAKARAGRRRAAARSAVAAGPHRLGAGRDRVSREQARHTREKFREQLRGGRLDDRSVEVDARDRSFPSFEIVSGSNVEEIDINIKDALPGLFQGRTKKRRLPVPEALEHLIQEEQQKLIDMESVARTAVARVEQTGIIFLDEIDKIAGREGGHGPDVSREGVQRDILPIVEGTTVNTKHGMVRTDHILFIAAGAFHVSKPSDLIPELQGRFPIRVELDSLGSDDFVRILSEPKNALMKQYTALLDTEGVDARFTDDAIEALRILRRWSTSGPRTSGLAAFTPSWSGCSTRSRSMRLNFEKVDHNRSPLRRTHAGRHRQERGPIAVYSVNPERILESERVMRSARAWAWRRWSAWGGLSLVLVAGVTAACGKKGPPLAPLARVPRPPAEFTARRLGSQVYVRFKVPENNTDNERPASLQAVEVYAMTGNPRTLEDFLDVGTLVASVIVRTPAPPPPAPEAPGLPPPPPPPPRPYEPGVEQGAEVLVSELLTPEMATPVLTEEEERRLEQLADADPLPPPVVPRPLLGPIRQPPLLRYYVAVGVNRRGRRGPITPRAGVPLSEPPESPAKSVVTYTANAVTVTWTPPASARRPVQEPQAPPLPGPGVVPGPPGGAAPPATGVRAPARPIGAPGVAPTSPTGAPGAATPPVTTPGGVATATPAAGAATRAAPPGDSLSGAAAGKASQDPAPPATLAAAAGPPELYSRPWFQLEPPSGYNVYDVTAPARNATGTPAPPEPSISADAAIAGSGAVVDPAVVESPFPLNQSPLLLPPFVDPRVAFGSDRCYAVRMVDARGAARLESEPSPPACVKIVDAFAPAAPRSLAAVAGEASISLIWEANTEADLVGYTILRGEAGSATLQPLTKTPIKETTFRDESAKTGVRYVYAVTAVDNAKPPNMSAESNRVEETAR